MARRRYVLVDGYNVINSWIELKFLKDDSLEEARHKLVDMLLDYASFKEVNVVIVFDAHLVKGSIEKHENDRGIEIVYTKEGETADCYIERTVVELSKRNTVGVVTLDYVEQQVILQMGGYRITPREFLNEVRDVSKGIREKIDIPYVDKRNTIEDFVDKKILEKLERMRRNL